MVVLQRRVMPVRLSKKQRTRKLMKRYLRLMRMEVLGRWEKEVPIIYGEVHGNKEQPMSEQKTEGARTVSGRVDEIMFTPGVNQLLIRLVAEGEPQPYWVLMPGGIIKIDGVVQDSLAEVLSHCYLMIRPGVERMPRLNVTLHPRQDRFEASTNAEFETFFLEEEKK